MGRSSEFHSYPITLGILAAMIAIDLAVLGIELTRERPSTLGIWLTVGFLVVGLIACSLIIYFGQRGARADATREQEESHAEELEGWRDEWNAVRRRHLGVFLGHLRHFGGPRPDLPAFNDLLAMIEWPCPDGVPSPEKGLPKWIASRSDIIGVKQTALHLAREVYGQEARFGTLDSALGSPFHGARGALLDHFNKVGNRIRRDRDFAQYVRDELMEYKKEIAVLAYMEIALAELRDIKSLQDNGLWVLGYKMEHDNLLLDTKARIPYV